MASFFQPFMQTLYEGGDMDQILINLSDPSWWFTGAFFVLFGIVLTLLIFNWIPKIWRKTTAIKPVLSRRLYRWKEKKYY